MFKLHKYSRIYGTNPHVSVAIAMQESSLRHMDRTIYALVDSEVKKVVTDIGLFQFHVKTVRNLNIDMQRLRDDFDYHVEQHVKLLKRKMKICEEKDNSWSCYHSFTERLRNDYTTLVLRYL
jgi:tRNA(Phe) wybutosine-synthesizing methylase Tyw3